MTMLKGAAGVAAVLGWMAVGAPAAEANTQYEISQIQKATPSCRDHPDAPWIGRVSGSVEDDVTDFIIPVSFVGCFDSQAVCERWKEKTSGFITGPIIQYSCKRR